MTNQGSLSDRCWSYFFDKNDDQNIHQPISSTTTKSYLKKLRLLCLVLMSVQYLLLFWVAPTLWIQLQYLTRNGYLLTWLYFSLVVVDGCFEGNSVVNSPKLKYWITMIFEASLCLQIPITIIYWLLLVRFDFMVFPFWQATLFASSHAIPIGVQLLDFAHNRYRFKSTRVWALIIIGLLYIPVNYSYSTLVAPVYPIITWKDTISIVYIVVAYGLAIGSFFIFRKIVHSIKFKNSGKTANQNVQKKIK